MVIMSAAARVVPMPLIVVSLLICWLNSACVSVLSSSSTALICSSKVLVTFSMALMALWSCSGIASNAFLRLLLARSCFLNCLSTALFCLSSRRASEGILYGSGFIRSP